MGVDDKVEIHGHLAVWERPEDMTVEEFLAIPHNDLLEILGPPVAEADNMFVNNWFSDVFSVMGSGAANIAVSILALGTGAMAGLPTRADSTMVVEWNRYAPLVSSVGSVDPITTTFTFFTPASDGAAAITEAGLWHGGATSIAGSGRMTSHLAWTYAKSATTDARLDYTITRGLT